MDNKAIDSIRECFYDNELYKACIPDIVNNFVEESNPKAEQRGMLHALYDGHIRQRYNIVSQYSESPIEQLFLHSLGFRSLSMGPGFMWFVEPTSDIEKQIGSFNELLRNYLEFRGSTDNGDNFPNQLDSWLAEGRINEDERGELSAFFVLYECCNLKDGYHVTIQAGLPDKIRVDGKKVRADLVVWKPGDSNLRLIVECDGYQYHGDKDSFSADRKRDRVLNQNGYQVLRFSGPEIHANPIAVADELIRYLIALNATGTI